jgi:ABC-type multidrug transport system ATPase subunit
LSLQTGRITAIVGPNGAGKTTLLRVAAGLEFPDAGQVEVAGALYFGGFEQLPLRGTTNQLRRSLGLAEVREHGDRRLSTLSRGELQRVGLSIAFDLQPQVLLLDEPWTALEPDEQASLGERMKKYAERFVMVCSSHNLDEVARLADDVILMSHGRLRLFSRESFADGFARDFLLDEYRRFKCG